MSATTGNAFRLDVEPDGLAILTFDLPGERANKYSTPVMTELEAVLDGLAKRSDVKALLLVSGKPDIFIAGADVNEIAKASDPAAIANGVRRGQEIFGKLANLPFPTVAAIEGACVGGGCETILAMDWRLASDSKKTQIGLPEIKLGILPAWGGTTRLPRVVGLTAALDVILAGKVIDSKRAQKMGLVDQLVPAPILLDAAKKFARGKFGTKKRANAAPDGGPLRVAPAKAMDRILEGVGRSVVFSKARASVMKETHGNYPAPLEALAAVEKGFGRPLAEALKLEVDAISRLVGTPAMKSLVNLFFRMEEVKKETGVAAGIAARPVKRIGVLGAGAMGGGIAQLAADKGWPVRMKDIRHEALAAGLRAGREDLAGQGEEAPDDPDGVRGEDVAPVGWPFVGRLRRLRRDDRSGPREARGEAGGPEGVGGRRAARRDLRVEHLDAPHHRDREGGLPARAGRRACTSSTRFTRCRSSR